MAFAWKVKDETKDKTIIKKRPIWKKKRLWFSLLLVLLLGIGGFLLVQKNRMNQFQNSTKSVKSAEVEIGSISEDIDGSGSLAASDTVDVKIPTGIIIEKISVESGDKVEKGQEIATVKKSSIVSALVDIESSLDKIEDSLDDDDDLTDLEIEELKLQRSDLKEAKSTLTALKKNPVITATCTGIIGDINVVEGVETSQNSTSSSGSSASGGSSSYSASFQSANTSKTAQASYMLATITPTTGMITYTGTVTETKEASINETVNEGTSDPAPEATSTEEEEDTKPAEDSSQSGDKQEDASGSSSKEDSSSGSTESSSQQSTQSSTQAQQNTQPSSQAQQNTQPSTQAQQPTTQQPTTQQPTTQQQAGQSGMSMPSAGASGASATAGATAATGTSSSSTVYSANEMCGFTINTMEKVKVSISVDELDILSIKEGQTATITIDAIGEEEFEGTITKVSTMPSSSSGNSKYTVDIELDMTENMLLGMTASAVIHISQATNVPVIPMSALQQEGNTTYVYTTCDDDGNLGGKVEVETGLSDGSNVQIKSGLNEGDTVYYTRSDSSDSSSNPFGGSGMPGGGMPGGGSGERPSMPSGGFPSGGKQ